MKALDILMYHEPFLLSFSPQLTLMMSPTVIMTQELFIQTGCCGLSQYGVLCFSVKMLGQKAHLSVHL